MPTKNKYEFCLIYNGYYDSPKDVAEHFHDNTELVFIRSGSCSTTAQGYSPLLCETGIVCVIPPRLRHGQQNGSADVYTQYVIFAGPTSLENFSVIPVGKDPLIAHWFTDIQQLSWENATEQAQILLNLLVERLQRVVTQSTDIGRYPPKLLQAVEFIENNYNRPVSAAEIIRRSNVSRTCLTGLFVKFFKLTIMKYLTEVRMYHARQLLCMNQYRNIGEIAVQTGYADPDYFCRKFKSIYGITPMEYRNYPSRFTNQTVNRNHRFLPLSMQAKNNSGNF